MCRLGLLVLSVPTAVFCHPPQVVVPKVEIAPGIMMPMVSVGTGGYSTAQHDTTKSMVQTWLGLGGRGIDTAWMYMDQADVAAGIAASGVPRDEIFITTKFLVCGGRRLTRWFVEYDLRALNTTYIDLLLLHYPAGIECAETWATLEEYVAKGVVRSIGVSNFRRAELERLLRTAKVKPAVNQVQVNFWWHNRDTAAFCREQNISLMGYSPLGWTGGKPKNPSNTMRTLDNLVVKAIAHEHGVSPAQVPLRWIVQQGYSLAVQSNSQEHLQQDADIFNFTLSHEEMTQLDVLDDPEDPSAVEVIGILGQSGGDVQSCSEVEAYTKNLFVMAILPQNLPEFVRRKIADSMWKSGGNQTMEQYRAVPNEDCNTRMRDLSVLQSQVAAAKLRDLTGQPYVQAFSGWKYAYGPGVSTGTPTVFDALEQMQAAGVTKAFVFDQDDMAFDASWEGLTYVQIRQYLAKHKEWTPTFIGINGFTEQPGFLDLLEAKLRQQLGLAFPGLPDEQICVLLPSQGVPEAAEAKAGSSIPRLRKAFAELQARMPQLNLTVAFTNHKPPGTTALWSQPDEKEKIPEVASSAYSCQHVLTSPLLQWPQTDYTVYVFQGNGTADEPGYAKIFAAAGKAYKRMPSWDLAPEEWQQRPPSGDVISPSTVDHSLPDFVAGIIADVLSGNATSYDLTSLGGTDVMFV